MVMRWWNHIKKLENNPWNHGNFKGGNMNVNETMKNFVGTINKYVEPCTMQTNP